MKGLTEKHCKLRCVLCGGTFGDTEEYQVDEDGNMLHDECAMKLADPTQERAEERSDLCEK